MSIRNSIFSHSSFKTFICLVSVGVCYATNRTLVMQRYSSVWNDQQLMEWFRQRDSFDFLEYTNGVEIDSEMFHVNQGTLVRVYISCQLILLICTFIIPVENVATDSFSMVFLVAGSEHGKNDKQSNDLFIYNYLHLFCLTLKRITRIEGTKHIAYR